MRNSSFVSAFPRLLWVVPFPTSVTADRHHVGTWPPVSELQRPLISPRLPERKDYMWEVDANRNEKRNKVESRFLFSSLGTFGLNIPRVLPHEFSVSTQPPQKQKRPINARY